jgi:hypothetical protein
VIKSYPILLKIQNGFLSCLGVNFGKTLDFCIKTHINKLVLSICQ